MSDVTTLYENDAFSTLTATLDETYDRINYNSAEASRFPPVTPGSGGGGAGDEYFYATIEDVNGKVEIVKVIEHDPVGMAGEFIVERAVDGSTASEWEPGDYIEMRPNAAVFDELRDHNHEGVYADKLHDHSDPLDGDTYIRSDDTDPQDMVGPLLSMKDADTGEPIPPIAEGEFTNKKYVDKLNFIDVAGAYPGLILSSSIVIEFLTVRSYTLPIDLVDSLANSGVAPTNAVTFTIKKNISVIGFLKFASGSKVATFEFTKKILFEHGDMFSITAQIDTHDMESLRFNITGTLV